jgi:hypothetical protein
MSKITAEHLARSAYVYIRQSTADQLTHNHESQRRQYGLVNRAKHLGWTDVEVIDDDLGRSGGALASSACWPRSAKRAWAPCSRSRRRGWRATAVTGIH